MIKNTKKPIAWRHGNWKKIQLNYFQDVVKIRREKNIEDYIINNGVSRIYVIKDNTVLDKFIAENNIELVDPAQADLVVITDQRFSRFDPTVMIDKLNALLNQCPRVYLCLNRYYLNANESVVDTSLSDHYDTAIVQWFTKNLKDSIVLNRSQIFVEDGSFFTWVIPSCELLICKK